MVKRLLVLFCFITGVGGKLTAQCPQIIDYLGNPSAAPLFKSCNGLAYNLNFESPANWGAYTINWGDSSPNNTGGSYVAGTTITHMYPAGTQTFFITLSIPSQGCTQTSTVIMEQAAVATISLTNIGANQCAPKTLTFSNITANQSPATTFTWTWGDGSPPQVFNSVTSPSVITHTFQKKTVSNCQTTVFLYARNNCNFLPSFDQKGPLQIYDTDVAQVSPDQATKCWPENTFTLTNTTLRNCLPQGNTGQRYEYWNLGDNWGKGYDSIIPWKQWPPTAPAVISFTALGTYTVMLVDSNDCGIDDVIQTLRIDAPPTASLIAPGGNLCQNTSLTFTNASTGSATNFSWNFGDGGGFANLGAGNKSHTYTNPGTYTVTMIASVGGSGSCRDTAKVVVTILASPVSAFVLSPAAGCHSLGAVSFTNNSTGAVTYTWTFGNGNVSMVQVPPPQDYTLAGSYTPTLVVTAASGCTHTSTGALIVRPNPVPSFVPFAACVGASVSFTNNSTPVSGTNSIVSTTWDFGDLSGTSNSLTPIHTYTLAGTYTVKLVVSSAFCSDSLKLPITINVKPTASFVATPTVGCPSLPVTFSNTSTNANTYLWKFTQGLSAISTLTNPVQTFTNGSALSFENYTVTLISTIGSCVDSIKKPISVRPKPVANFTTNTITGCSPLLTNFSNTSIGYATSKWTFGDGTPDSFLQHPNHSYLNTSLFTNTVIATLVVTNSVSCVDSVKKLITIYPEALTAFTMVPASGCSPLYVSFMSVPGVATYSWNHGDGTPTYTTLTAHSWTYANTGSVNQTAPVTLTVQTSNGCIGTGSGLVTIFYNPVANFSTNPGAGCSPLQVNFSNTSTGHSNSRWQFSNGQTVLLPNASSTFTNATGAGQFSYTAKLVVGTSNNCFDSITKTVLLYPQPKAGFTPDTPACSPKTIRITSSSTGANLYNWNFGDGQSVSTTSAGVSHYFVNTTGGNTPFNVKLVAVSPDFCKDSITIPVIIHPKPVFFITSQPDSGCSPLKVKFDNIPGVADYQWKYDGISFGSAGNIENLFENKDPIARTINIELVARDAHTCADTAGKQIRVFPVPTAKFSAKPLSVFIPNQPTFFTNESTPASLTYQWEFGDGEKSEEYSPSHTYTKAGEYQSVLIVSNSYYCRDTFALPSKVFALDESSVEIPNAFTPNISGSPGSRFDPGDTSNDIFHPNVKGTDKYNFSIYSRWGELLFDTKDPEEGWDGYYKGKLCTQDVYVWKITASFIDGRKLVKTGDVLLLR